MKFPGFKEFRGNLKVSYASMAEILDDTVNYLSVDLTRILRELVNGLTKLNFSDNFQSFLVTVEIPATTEIAIPNDLRDGSIPSHKLILRGKSGAQDVVDGDAEWTQEFVYLKNTGASAVTVTVLFLK